MSVKNESGGVIVVYFKALTWNFTEMTAENTNNLSQDNQFYAGIRTDYVRNESYALGYRMTATRDLLSAGICSICICSVQEDNMQ
jgi:hypothetical protein